MVRCVLATGGAPAAPGKGPSTSIADRGATTVDALFAPLTITDTPGRVWIYTVAGNTRSLVPLDVRTGINDGTYAELIAASGLGEGSALLTNVDTGQQAARSNNPLMPGRQMGHGDGGHGGPH